MDAYSLGRAFDDAFKKFIIAVCVVIVIAFIAGFGIAAIFF